MQQGITFDTHKAINDLVKVGFKPEQAEALVEFEKNKDVPSNLATKQDITALEQVTKEKITKMERSTKEDISRLERSTKEDMANLEKATREEITKLELSTKQEMVKLEKSILELKVWTLKMMAGQVALIVALIKLL